MRFDATRAERPTTGEDPGSLAGYLFALSRPRFWLYLAGPTLVGAVWAAGGLSDLLAPSIILAVAYFLVPANLFLYGVNDRFDAPREEAGRVVKRRPRLPVDRPAAGKLGVLHE